MWSRSVSQLDHDLPLEARRRRRFPEKYQRPLSDREKEIVQVPKSHKSAIFLVYYCTVCDLFPAPILRP